MKFIKKMEMELPEKLCMAGLMLFMILFCGYSLLISPNAAYRITKTGLFGLKRLLSEQIVPIGPTVLTQLVILILAAWFFLYLFKYLELPTVSVVVPLFVLLTISMLFQDYTRRGENSLKHFLFMLSGFVCLMLGLFISKYVSYADARKEGFIKALLILMGANVCLLLVWTLVFGYLLKNTVNGAYGIIPIGPLSYTPVEWQKLFILLFTDAALIDMRVDKKLRHRFYILMGISILAVFLSKDIGNLFILLILMGIVLYLLESIRLLLVLGSALLALIGFGYWLYSMGMFPSGFGYMIDRFNSVFTAATSSTADSTRQALLAALRDGIFGSGTGIKMYVDNVYAVYTDYAFIAIQAIFGIGISFLVILCYMVLFYSLGTGFDDSKADPMVYICSNTLGSVLMVQTIIHVAVNLNIFPYTGVVLPFISAGGSSTLMCFLCLGLILGVRVGDVPYKSFLRSRRRKK